jgi:hypothetical protein
MTDPLEVRKLVITALADLRGRKPHGLFTPDEIITIVENGTDQKPALDEVNAILREQWGHGIEPFSISGSHWKFGPGKPPRSQLISVPGSLV